MASRAQPLSITAGDVELNVTRSPEGSLQSVLFESGSGSTGVVAMEAYDDAGFISGAS